MRKHVLKLFFFGFVLLLPLSLLQAVPAYPYPITITQADGSELTFRMHGGCGMHGGYATTLDNYLITQNAEGSYEYADVDAEGNFIPLGLIARNERTKEEERLLRKMEPMTPSRAKILFKTTAHERHTHADDQPISKANSLFGTKRGLVILVNFKDKSFITPNPKQAFSRLLNEKGYKDNGGTGSASDYFAASSNGAFTPIFDVVGPYNLPQNMAYYGARSGDNNDVDARQMIVSACMLADPDVDFSQYDTDNDGQVDNVFVYYAGNNEAEGGGANTIWPHRWVLNYGALQLDGKYVYDYACTSELRGVGRVMCGIGTFCHEFSHVLGLPDFYPTNGSNHYTVGTWDIMASGAYNNSGNTPPSYTAHERFFLGYLTPEVLVNPAVYYLEPLTEENTAYMISPVDAHNLVGDNPNPTEYFLLENRQRLGWDSIGLPGTGLLITHIKYNQSAWNSNTPNNDPSNLRMDIIEANNNINRPSGHTFPGTSVVTAFSPVLENGSQYDASLSFIEEDYQTISFRFRGGGEAFPNLSIIGNEKAFKTVVGTPSEPSIFNIAGSKLDIDRVVTLSFSVATHYEMKLSSDSSDNWSKTLTISPAVDSTLNVSILVRYNPTKASFKEQHVTLLQALGEIQKRLELSGQSTRAVYVLPPDTLPASEIAPYAFKANWKSVYDATGYYTTVYTKEGATMTKENFGTFNTEVPLDWRSTFSKTTSISPASLPYAVLFTSVNDTLWSEHYPMAASKIKYWLRNEDFRQSGMFYIEGFDGETWYVIDSVIVDKTISNGKTLEISLNQADNYYRFKFYTKNITSNGVSFDDFSVEFPLTVVVNKQFGTAVEQQIINLNPNVSYFYKVQATDKDPLGRYENVTDFSEEVFVVTNDGNPADSRALTATFTPEGVLLISVRHDDLINANGEKLDLYIYTVQGQLVDKIPYAILEANPNYIAVSGLMPLQAYIISLGSQRNGKYVKVIQPR